MMLALYRNIRPILAFTALFMILISIVTAFISDKYTATVLVVVDTRNARLVDPNAATSPAADGEVEIMKSESVASDVAERLNLDKDPEFSPTEGVIGSAKSSLGKLFRYVLGGNSTENLIPGTRQAMRNLQKRVTIRRRGLTDVIAIEATSTNARRAAELANTYADVYIEQQVDAKLATIEKAKAALSRRLNEINEDLERPGMRMEARESYKDSLARLTALSQQRELVGPDVRVVSQALVPETPTSPPRSVIIALAAVLGFGLAWGAAFFKEKWRV